jgi:hypothetical protein
VRQTIGNTCRNLSHIIGSIPQSADHIDPANPREHRIQRLVITGCLHRLVQLIGKRANHASQFPNSQITKSIGCDIRDHPTIGIEYLASVSPVWICYCTPNGGGLSEGCG